jgi:hypothetical protein
MALSKLHHGIPTRKTQHAAKADMTRITV